MHYRKEKGQAQAQKNKYLNPASQYFKDILYKF